MKIGIGLILSLNFPSYTSLIPLNIVTSAELTTQGDEAKPIQNHENSAYRSILEVCHETGINSQSAFNAVFKKQRNVWIS